STLCTLRNVHRHRADAAYSLLPRSNRPTSGPTTGPLTIRTMREHGFLLSSEPAKHGPQVHGVFKEAVPATLPRGRGGQVLFFEGPWPGSEGAALVRRSFSWATVNG